MAGYIMTLDSEESLNQCILTGTYSTKMSQPNGKWRTHHEGTFADYLSMKEGDYIFFFIKRKIYGIGTLIAIKDECKYLNYINANYQKKLIRQNIEIGNLYYHMEVKKIDVFVFLNQILISLKKE